MVSGGPGNLTVTIRYGPRKARRKLPCRSCKARFSERKGTPLFDARRPPETVESVVEHVAEGGGSRRIGRLCRVNPNTVARYSRIAGGRARNAHDELVAVYPRTTEAQFDEKWAIVAKKEAHCDRTDPADDHKGDYWDHVALDPEHQLDVILVPGGRTAETTKALVEDFRRRTGGWVMNLLTCDDHPPYATAILHAYGETVTPPRTC